MKCRFLLSIVLVIICFLGSSCEKDQENLSTVKVKLTKRPWVLSKNETLTYVNNILDTIRTSYSYAKIEFFSTGKINYELDYTTVPMKGTWRLNDNETVIYTDLKIQTAHMILPIFNDVKIVELNDSLLTIEEGVLLVISEGDSILHIPRSYYINTK